MLVISMPKYLFTFWSFLLFTYFQQLFVYIFSGYLHMLVISAKGLRQMMKTRWFVYDRKAGKLKYYRNEREEQNGLDPVGEIDITSSTFCYNVEEDNSGEFTIW